MSRLPGAAQRKLSAIEQSAADAAALSSAAADTLARLQTELHNAAQRRDSRPDARVDDEIRRVEGEIEAVRETQARRRERRTNDAQVLARLTAWLAQLPPTVTLEPAEFPEPGAEALADPGAALTAQRAELGALNAELIRERASPPTRLEARAGLEAWVRRLAEESTPRLDFGGNRFSLTFERNSMEISRGARPVALEGALAWLAPDLLLARASELADATLPEDSLPYDQRALRCDQLEEAIVRQGLAEEALVCLALERGIDVARRSGADPRCVLGVRVVSSRKRRAAA